MTYWYIEYSKIGIVQVKKPQQQEVVVYQFCELNYNHGTAVLEYRYSVISTVNLVVQLYTVLLVVVLQYRRSTAVLEWGTLARIRSLTAGDPC